MSSTSQNPTPGAQPQFVPVFCEFRFFVPVYTPTHSSHSSDTAQTSQAQSAETSQQQTSSSHPNFFMFSGMSPLGVAPLPMMFGPAFNQFFTAAMDPQMATPTIRPASKSALEKLTVHTLVEQDFAQGSTFQPCIVCQDDLKVGDHLIVMPCSHVFHSDCLMPWLQQHNSCPNCRYELETDDPAYNARLPEKNKTTSVPVPFQFASQASSSLSSRTCGFGPDCVLLDDFSTVNLHCSHTFHRECLQSYNNVRGVSNAMYQCPTCKATEPRDRYSTTTAEDSMQVEPQ